MKSILSYWKTVLLAAFIFYGSLTSSSNIDKVMIFHFKNSDKLIHCVFYFLLGISFLTSLHKNTSIDIKYQIFITVITVISYGILIELFQYYFTNDRFFELLDILADSVGCILAILIFLPLKKTLLFKYL